MTQSKTIGAKTKLPIEKRKAIAALMKGLTNEQAANAAGVDRSSIQRWLKEPDFQAELKEAEGEIIASVTRRLTGLADSAISTLVRIYLSETVGRYDSTRVRAAVALLDQLNKFRNLVDFETRLTALEGSLKNDTE